MEHLTLEELRARWDGIYRFLDTIDIKSEMIWDEDNDDFVEEDLGDFMERLEAKYSTPKEISASLFDEIDTCQFMDYLNERYGRYCVVETVKRTIWRPDVMKDKNYGK